MKITGAELCLRMPDGTITKLSNMAKRLQTTEVEALHYNEEEIVRHIKRSILCLCIYGEYGTIACIPIR